MKRSPRAALVVVVTAAAGMLAIGQVRSWRGGDRSGVIAPARRGLVRELAFQSIGGGEWRLSEQRGRVVAVNLWATWCGPCREETPTLVRVEDGLRREGFEVMGVSLDTGRGREEAVTAFAQRYRIRYALGFPLPGSQMESALEGIPTTLLFDRQGRAAKVYVGSVSESELLDDAEMLLRER